VVQFEVIATSSLVSIFYIIVVYANSNKESWAKKFGAHKFVNSVKLPERKRIQDYLVEITNNSLDFTFNC